MDDLRGTPQVSWRSGGCGRFVNNGMDLERIRIAVVMDPEKGNGHLFSCSETRVRHVKLQYSSPSLCIPFLFFFFLYPVFPLSLLPRFQVRLYGVFARSGPGLSKEQRYIGRSEQDVANEASFWSFCLLRLFLMA